MSAKVSATSFRILPAAAVALTLLLGLKLAGFGSEMAVLFGSRDALASDPAAAKPEEHAAEDAHSDKPKAKDEKKAGESEDAAEETISASEADVLESLSKRREQLDQRERDLDMREKTLQAAEKRVEARIAELKTIESRIETLFGKRDETEEKQILDLVKMYEAMKPANAAAIFNTLEQGVLIDVVRRMKPAKASPILAAMKPERAQDITVELARRGRLPDELDAAAAAAAPADAAPSKPGG